MTREPTAGELRQRITFQQPVKAEDGYGGHVVTWANLVSVWARVEPISGREYFEAHKIQAEVTHRVKVRWLVTVNKSMRILYGERVLEIESIIDIDERRKFLEIFCRESK